MRWPEPFRSYFLSLPKSQQCCTGWVRRAAPHPAWCGIIAVDARIEQTPRGWLQVTFDFQPALGVQVIEALDLIPVAVHVADDQMPRMQPPQVLPAPHLEHPRPPVRLHFPPL